MLLNVEYAPSQQALQKTKIVQNKSDVELKGQEHPPKASTLPHRYIMKIGENTKKG
jgi:hypothetical protein